MNNVSLSGRLTKNPELRYGGQENSTAIARFTLAVDDGRETDFINIKCFGRTAEWVDKWLSKGNKAEVTGKIKTGSFCNLGFYIFSALHSSSNNFVFLFRSKILALSLSLLFVVSSVFP